MLAELANVDKAMSEREESDPTAKIKKAHHNPDGKQLPNPKGLTFEKAKELVHAQYTDLLADLKKKSNQWWLLREYKERVLPRINALMNPVDREEAEGIATKEEAETAIP